MKPVQVLFGIFVVFAIIGILWDLWEKARNKGYFRSMPKLPNADDEDDEEMSKLFDEYGQKRTNNIKYSYDPSQLPDVTFGSYKPPPINTMDFKMFKEMVVNPDYIRMYKQAVVTNYKYKIYRYKLMLKELNNVLNENSDQDSHNSTVARTKICIAEVTKVLTLARKKLPKINLDEIYNNLVAIVDSKDGLGSIVGRDRIKDQIVRNIFSFSRDPISFSSTFQNIALYGSPGLGKTRLGQIIGTVYSKSGILVRGEFRKTTKQDFTSGIIDESAALTRQIFFNTLESVLFIDEAYGLTPPKSLINNGGNDHRQDAVTEMVNALDQYKGLNIVVVAGYKDKMEQDFMKSNKGMRRRFKTVIELTPYSTKQLTDILLMFLHKQSETIEITNSDAALLYKIVSYYYENNILFENQAGDAEKLASSILESKNSSLIEWGSYESNYQIIGQGVNNYLLNNGIRDNFVS